LGAARTGIGIVGVIAVRAFAALRGYVFTARRAAWRTHGAGPGMRWPKA